MTEYTDELKNFSRRPCRLLVITGHRCSEVYGVSPCTASGSPGEECYNTWPTCQDLDNFDDETYSLKFTSLQSNIPFAARPYLDRVAPLPTTIQQKISSKSRVKYHLFDEQDGDVGIDPYFTNRSSIQGTYWKKFLARNQNYSGWSVAEYSGFVGIPESDYEQRWVGNIENITLNGGKVVVDCINLMADLDKKKVPDRINTKLQSAITSSQTSFILTSLYKEDEELIDSSGYIKIEDEIVYYASFTESTKELNGCIRGQFSTTAVSHGQGTRVSIIEYFAPDNPFDILQVLWVMAGGNIGDLDTSAWSYWRDWPVTDIDFSAIITEDNDVSCSDLFWEIVNLLDCHVWQNEDQKISIRRNQANEPDREYIDITDDGSIIHQSGSGDYNDSVRKTRILLYYGLGSIGDDSKRRDYDDLEAATDPSYELTEAYGEIREEVLFSRWFSKRYLQSEVVESYANGLALRRLLNRLDPKPIVAISVERKDEGIKTGDNIRMTTDEILNADGSPSSGQYLVISRKEQQNRIELKGLKFPPNRFCFIAPDTTPDYDSTLSTDTDKEYGHITQNDGIMPNSDPGYHIY